ncbi:hypothetical protein P153DRAFT_321887 [Dothidotthia symphoricarpi CBS 119687]|uniref:Mitochondrial protein from FMP27-domain-containing protein n=1 Tax=Dothidotthia symphoricarpi CBS 119687 TaxID=1392245 RepID=A0A6A6A7D0_9PLEO|nr:uncharacterized protein P153DRAFT_321887 [Dothidotthia symphoricarpi CBS 119687]KAF2126974.1 hypothetical protein P153DRAFT_321887 [Dothidotthia symphoricarpi CBS 119687]
MALPTLQFLAGLLVLLYLLSFVLFAFIRVVTGVSVQRLGYSGLRRIAFTPKDGLRIEIRGLGFSLHRPTFAQPTWVSVVLTEAKVIVDLKALGEKPRKKARWAHWTSASTHTDKAEKSISELAPEDESEAPDGPGSQTWKRLTEAKEQIKRLHGKILWIRQVDLMAQGVTMVVKDVGSLHVGSLVVAVDTRRKTVDHSRLFNHHKPKPDEQQRPAEWRLIARTVLFTPEGRESTEILDHCTLNIHGFLKKELEGLRDASIALKLGRLLIPYDDLHLCLERANNCRPSHSLKSAHIGHTPISLTDIIEELDQPGTRKKGIARAVSDSKEFASSILRGIHEFQFAVSFLGLTKQFHANHELEPPVYLNISMKELGMDLLRLDPRSPAHLMYFSPDDIAHQALLAATQISVGLDDGNGHPERLLYIPMATTTLNTTLPSKTVQFSDDENSAERNTNILFANLVITSPSLDLDPKHLPLLLAMFRNFKSQRKPSKDRNRKRNLVGRLLPKANIKISVHEPVIRVTLPPTDPEKQGSDEFDLLISASSSMSWDMESSHAADGELHYALVSTFRMNSQQLYYQNTSSEKHNLLTTDYLETKAQLSATPNIALEIRSTAQSFSISLVRPEIIEGLRQINAQLQKDMSRGQSTSRKQANFLRKLPPWLAYVHLQGSDWNLEVAGVDPAVSKHSRGIALHLDTWTAEYKQSRDDESELKPVRRRASRTINRDEHLLRSSTISSPMSPRKTMGNATDGRRLALHFHGLEGLIIESADQWENDPCLSLPAIEIAFSTSSDKQGTLFHVHCFSQSLFVHHSLYRHFAVMMAMQVLARSFHWRTEPVTQEVSTPPNLSRHLTALSLDDDSVDSLSKLNPEIMTIEAKAQFVQVKIDMPSDPHLMLQIYGLEASRNRWTNPQVRSRLVRLYAENPNIEHVWSRIVSVKSLRIDYRKSKRRYGHTVTNEQSFDVATDAIRFAVPHQLVIHKIFDNVANVTKTIKQVQHRFRTGSDDYVLNKEPEGPKHVPKISLRSRAVLFELEDSSFEWKLGTIYRIGLMEQKQRLARAQAFDLKVKRLQHLDEQRGNSRQRARSAHGHRARSKSKRRDKEFKFHRRGKSEDSSGRDSMNRDRMDYPMRYNSDGFSGLSGSCQTSIEEAREKLNRLNAQTWRKRIDHALGTQTRVMHDIRSVFWGLDEIPDGVEQKETILAIPQRPALMALAVSDLDIVVDKPSFPLSEYPRFLHRVGKGMPFETQYALLIPMLLQVNMGEAKIVLRDYPLPLLHIPSIGTASSSRLPSLSLKTDFVIAEEYRDVESSRVSRVVVVPQECTSSGELTGGFAVDIRRTVAPVKTYSEMAIDINSAHPTKITWGTSYQPAIQDMMQVIENFTKPAIDPSERVGFWDKIRLTFHSRINVSWKGDGDVHLILKGSRDPYMVTGHGAGFVMCWQNDVQLSVAEDEDPRNFMKVTSGNYVLAIPDLSHYARHDADSLDSTTRPETASSTSSRKQPAVFKKTVMKLNGNVRWVVGLVFERTLEDGGRSFNFGPHYDVVLKNPKHARPSGNKQYDAFRGFRSDHIHMSIAIAAPYDREWSVANLEPSKTYNSVHLTPRFFTHFFSWWSMFSGAMSLPVRQGKLWPGVEKSSKKFGRHLATIKYNLLLSPLYMSHIYKHKDAEDYGSDVVSATGLKARFDSFMLDLHMRREEFRTVVQAPKNQADSKQNQTTGMRINQVQLDLIRTDVRAISASIAAINSDDVDNATTEDIANFNQEYLLADLSKFTIPDNDWGWVDMDDFIELGWILPSNRHPETQILPLAFAPHFTYFRQTDHADNISGDPNRTSAFGNEPTHHCVMSARNDPRQIQCGLIEQRIQRVKEQVAFNQNAIGDQELKIVREPEGKEECERRLDTLQEHAQILQRKLEFLVSMHESLIEDLRANERVTVAVPDSDTDEKDEYHEAHEHYPSAMPEEKGTSTAPIADYISDFNNRFIIHNVHLKWSNSQRNIILRYIHQVSQRRGFVYYMSRRAVKFILDVVEEQNKSRGPSTSERYEGSTTPMTPPDESGPSIDDHVEQLLQDARNFIGPEEPTRGEVSDQPESHQANGGGIASEYVPQNAYIVRLIAPQIQLQSEKDIKAAVLVTAKGMQLKVLQIMDRDRVNDDVSGLVQRRFTAAMNSMQIFVTNTKTFGSMEDIHMYSGSTYGAPVRSAWPPWVPFEVMFEFHSTPYGFQRVIQKTSASMRFDKYNTLRLKYNDDISGGDSASSTSATNKESRIDHIWVDFPHIRALCDSRQYYAMYVIVLDLLLYSEPLGKTRNERLEKIMLASDFSDLTGAPNLVIGLQERIRQLEEIKTVFQVNETFLDKQGWEDRIEVEKDLAIYEDELFFVMKAITTTQRKQDDRAQAKESTGLLRWYISASEIVWHLLREGEESLAEFQLKNAVYDRTDHNDGSNSNLLEIGKVRGLNLLPNALYPEMISPYLEKNRVLPKNARCLKVEFIMLEAIAGIPVMEHFEVSLFPLKVQLEYEIGKKLFEYVFPTGKNKNGENGNSSPFLIKHALPSPDEDDDDGNDASVNTSMSASFSQGNGIGEALKQRLTPTLQLPDPQQKSDRKIKSSPEKRPGAQYFRFFRDNPSRSGTELRRTLHPSSALAPPGSSPAYVPSRPGSIRTGSTTGSIAASQNESERSSKRFALYRTGTNNTIASDKRTNKKPRSDDLTQMMNRANNYMTLAYINMQSTTLCLSYKGKGQRNFEDVHDLVFKMPTLEYRNKTWSNLDLALQLKKDIMRALISHTGAIIGNKFSQHRPSKNAPSRLRQLTSSSTKLAASPDLSGTDSNSIRDYSAGESDTEANSRQSFTSGRQGSVFSTVSEESSQRSLRPGTSSDARSLRPGTSSGARSLRPATSSGARSTHGSIMGGYHGLGIDEVADGRAFADELSRVDNTEPVHANLIHSLSKHLTQVTPFSGHRRERAVSGGASMKEGSFLGGEEGDGEDGPKKKAKMFAQKFLGRSHGS